jgi:hypothetical protein
MRESVLWWMSGYYSSSNMELLQTPNWWCICSAHTCALQYCELKTSAEACACKTRLCSMLSAYNSASLVSSYVSATPYQSGAQDQSPKAARGKCTSSLSARAISPIVVLVEVRYQVMLSHPNAQHQNTLRRSRHDVTSPMLATRPGLFM